MVYTKLRTGSEKGGQRMLSIGEFSKICMVSIKTLRHYDKIGLMKPNAVNQETGYRYYSESQLAEMLLIQRLKRYGFPLAEISIMLRNYERDFLLERFTGRRKELERQMGEDAAALNELSRHIENLERTGDIMSFANVYEVRLEEAESIPIISARQNMSVDEFGKYYGVLYEKMNKEHIMPDRKILAIYHDKEFDPDNSDIEVAVGVKDADKAKATRILEGGLCARTLHKGSYACLTDAYAAVVRWINENGCEMAAPPYEIYTKNQFDGLPVEDWETEIYFPVKKMNK